MWVAEWALFATPDRFGIAEGMAVVEIDMLKSERRKPLDIRRLYLAPSRSSCASAASMERVCHSTNTLTSALGTLLQAGRDMV